jgi:rSAM/selenodomain-associated transferase 1
MTDTQRSVAHILIFLKAPLPGTVKTRLARKVGDTVATNIYKSLATSQLNRVPKDYVIEVHYAPSDAGRHLSDWLGPAPEYYPQVEGDLGDRIKESVSAAFRRGAHVVLCIGADCPSLQASHLDEASQRLSSGPNDLVIGPCPDGGYYLIGFRKDTPSLFEGVRWSAPETMEDTLQNAKKAGLRVHLLESMNDIDTANDLASAIQKGHLPPNVQFPGDPGKT